MLSETHSQDALSPLLSLLFSLGFCFFSSGLSKEMFPLKLRLRRNLGKGGFPVATEVRSGYHPLQAACGVCGGAVGGGVPPLRVFWRR